MKLSFSLKEKEYWSSICVACSQVTFGIFWAAIFLPIDRYKLAMILSNGIMSIALWFTGAYLIRKKN